MIRRNRPIPAFNKSRGFTLIEFLVAMVSSIIITGAVIALMVNTLSISSENIRSSRVTQEIRGAMEILSRDIRRAGSMPNAIDCYAQNACVNAHSAVTYFPAVGSTCVIFALDRNRDGDGDGDIDADDEKYDWTGFRYDAGRGAIQIKVSGAAGDDDCIDDGAWVDLTDPEVIAITAFSLDSSPSYDILVSQNTTGGTQSLLEVRKVLISITGQLVSGGSPRTINETIRLRNDRYVVQNIPTP